MGSTPIYSIPFADPTDLVRDWPALSEDVAEAVEAAVAGVPVLAGIGSNVVQTVKDDPFSTSTSTWVTPTSFTATITPTSNTSLVLVVVDLSFGPATTNAGGSSPRARLRRETTVIYGGASPGSREAGLFQTINAGISGETNFWANNSQFRFGAVFLDSPETDVATTYDVQVRAPSGVMHINRGGTDGNSNANVRSASSITLIEVAA